jgi:hypothetical protein
MGRRTLVVSTFSLPCGESLARLLSSFNTTNTPLHQLNDHRKQMILERIGSWCVSDALDHDKRHSEQMNKWLCISRVARIVDLTAFVVVWVG